MEEKNLELATQLRRELHTHPELSYQEVWTKQHLMNFIKRNTNLEIVDRGKWFYAIYRAGENKRNIAFRADFDALPIEETIELPWGSQNPGVSHKCGHDGHSACLAGFALEVDQKGSNHNIFFLFQHAEETGQGAIEAAAFIKEEKIDEIFAYHNMSGMPLRTVNVIDGTAHYASKGMEVKWIGSPAHASQPEVGTNPSYAIAKFINSIPEQTQLEDKEGTILCTIVQIDVGEEAYGMSAYEGVLRMTIRATKEKELNQFQRNLEQLAMRLANESEVKVSFSYRDEFPETANDKESSDKIRQVCQEQDIGLQEMAEPFRGSEDYGHYLEYTKGAMCYIGNGEDYPNVHTYEYDFCDEIIETAVKLFKGLAEVK